MSYILYPTKISQLSSRTEISSDDVLLVINSGSNSYSVKTEISDIVNYFNVTTGSYSGSFTGSFKGEASGAFNGNLEGNFISKNAIASGSFSGSLQGSLISKNAALTGVMSGSFFATGGNIDDLIATGSVSGSIKGNLLARNADLTGSIINSRLYGSLRSKNAEISGALSGSKFSGSLIGSNCSATGSFFGSFNGNLYTSNSEITGTYQGAVYSEYFSGTGSYYGMASLKGIDNIQNYNETGYPVSFLGTSSNSINSKYSSYADYVPSLINQTVYTQLYNQNNFFEISITKPVGTIWQEIELTIDLQIWTSGVSMPILVCWDDVSDATKDLALSYVAPSTGTGNLTQVPSTRGNDDGVFQYWHHIQDVPDDKKYDDTLTLQGSLAYVYLGSEEGNSFLNILRYLNPLLYVTIQSFATNPNTKTGVFKLSVGLRGRYY